MSALGTQCEISGLEPVSDLQAGMDFRDPRFRREVFLRFYEFHLKYRAHPGGVYYLIPWLQSKLGMSMEQVLWFCFINGCTQNPVTSYAVFTKFPDFQALNLGDMETWHRANWRKLDYDTDRRYCKGHLVEMVEDYKTWVGDSQVEFFNGLTQYKTAKENFNSVWDFVKGNFMRFGRLSTFSYLEYLRKAGLNIECSKLFLEDVDGSKSHRNGLCIVLGRDDMDWRSGGRETPHSKDEIAWLSSEADKLLAECRARFESAPYFADVGFFTLESTLCCYKSWHRENRRYPNVYNDMLYNRIKKAEDGRWSEEPQIDVGIFWQARRECLPKELLLEFNQNDPGLSKPKQNWYRNTGQVIMMDMDWPCFKNDFNARAG